jgi:hypothetical protein
MPTSKFLPVGSLRLDPKNYRTLPQKSEVGFLRAVTVISPDPFWALTSSLLDDGYLPNESIVVVDKNDVLTVLEGNRRIAALKWILGMLKPTNLNVPSDVTDRIAAVSGTWKTANTNVPCTIFSSSEEALGRKVVARIHGKSEPAGRDRWPSVATARHNRDENEAKEYGLDLLEKFIRQSSVPKASQKERWAGNFPLTVLDEAIKAMAPRSGFSSTRDFVKAYPTGPNVPGTDKLIHDIGIGLVGFPQLRSSTDTLASDYGFPALAPAAAGPGGTPKPPKKRRGPAALATNDPRAVRRALRLFVPVGRESQKVVTLLNEARSLNLARAPHAFCFLLRSMFEISAKVYARSHTAAGIKLEKNGRDRRLVDVLRDIVKHLTNNGKDTAMTKQLHGAITELAGSNGVLSVTSLNQLIHHPTFSVAPNSICTVFFNVLPLLEEMNS